MTAARGPEGVVFLLREGIRYGWEGAWRFAVVFGMMGTVVWYLGSVPDVSGRFLDRWGWVLVAAGSLFYYVLLLDNLARTMVRATFRVTVTRFIGFAVLWRHLAVTLPILAVESFLWRRAIGVSFADALISGGWKERALAAAGLLLSVGIGAGCSLGPAVRRAGLDYSGAGGAKNDVG